MDRAEQFWRLFQTVWNEKYGSGEYFQHLNNIFDDSSKWTSEMICKKSDHNDSILGKTAFKYLEFLDVPNPELRFEWGAVDLLGISWPSEKDYTLSTVHVLIEHENNKDIETEMWRLANLRAPLKVIVCYTFGDEEAFKKKLEELSDIKRRVDEISGSEQSEYLIIYGGRPYYGDKPDRKICFRAKAYADGWHDLTGF